MPVVRLAAQADETHARLHCLCGQPVRNNDSMFIALQQHACAQAGLSAQAAGGIKARCRAYESKLRARGGQ